MTGSGRQTIRGRGSRYLMVGLTGGLILLTACDRGESAERRSSAAGMRSPFDPDRPEPEGPVQRFAPGEWAKTTDYRMRVVRLETCEVEPYFAPLPGHEKLGIFVEIEGLHSVEVPVNVLHGHLTDGEGRSYAPATAGCRPTLPAGRVSQGKSARGFISFEVPVTSRGLTFEYHPSIVGRAPQRLDFDLPR